MRRRAGLAAAVVLGAQLLLMSGPSEAAGGCRGENSLAEVAEECGGGGGHDRARQLRDGHPTAVFSLRRAQISECPGGEADCTLPSCDDGERYWVLLDGEPYALVCLRDGEREELENDLPYEARRAFHRLRWPSAPLVVQPPGGEVLVNGDTIFHTTLDGPEQQTVTLLTSEVMIEATPVSYRWTFGDGAEVTTRGPGAPYPSTDVVHRYLRAERFAASVAVTYEGRFRVPGGDWTPIEGTLEVPGDAVALVAREARPVLVR